MHCQVHDPHTSNCKTFPATMVSHANLQVCIQGEIDTKDNSAAEAVTGEVT